MRRSPRDRAVCHLQAAAMDQRRRRQPWTTPRSSQVTKPPDGIGQAAEKQFSLVRAR